MIKRVVLALSGGIDSTSLLGYLIEHKCKIICVSFLYESKHNLYEISSVRKICEYYKKHRVNIQSRIIDLTHVFKNIKSNLMREQGEIPEGHYEEDSMKLTVVPGRNLIFASVLASVAESEGVNQIALGVHSGDHVIYPDCRVGFIVRLNDVIKHSTDFKVVTNTPFIYLKKQDILERGYKLSIPVPYHLTRTCYKDQEFACGKCGSCTERLEAFSLINKKDPVKYE